VREHQKAVSNSDNTDMKPVVRLAIEAGIEHLAAVDCPARRKRKWETVQVNGSIDDVSCVVEKNNDIVEDCEENIRRKKHKKASSQQSDIEQRRKVVTEASATCELTVATAGSESKSALDEEIEIWIPNKKYKRHLKDKYAELAKKGTMKVRSTDCTAFMTFIPSDKTPIAFVRRRNRLTQSEPKQLHRSVSPTFICGNSGRWSNVNTVNFGLAD